MKRRAVLGMLSTEHGVVKVTHRATAVALETAQQEIERQAATIHELRGKFHRARAELEELSGHPWVKLGLWLRFVR